MIRTLWENTCKRAKISLGETKSDQAMTKYVSLLTKSYPIVTKTEKVVTKKKCSGNENNDKRQCSIVYIYLHIIYSQYK